MNIPALSKRVCLTLGAITLSMTALHTKAQLSGNIDIGALIPAVGSELANTRPQIDSAFEFAIKRFNDRLAAMNPPAGWSLRIPQDFRLDPVAESLMTFQNASIGTILGPLTSGNLEDLIPVATELNQTLISYGSTSPAGIFRQIDNIFRILPDDSNQVPVIIDQMVADKITSVIVVYRNDAWGRSLNAEFSDNWPQIGTRFLGAAVSYVETLSSKQDFVSIASTLQTRVQAAIEQSNAASVAVFAIGFEELAGLFEAAADQTSLSRVRFYGIDTHDVIVENEAARNFANSVQYTISQVAPDKSHTDYVAFEQHLSTVTTNPASYAFAAADTVELVGRAIEQAGSADAAAVSAALPMVASNYEGLLGPARFNLMGDRAMGRYEFKQVSGNQFVDLTTATPSTGSASRPAATLMTLLVAFTGLFVVYEKS